MSSGETRAAVAMLATLVPAYPRDRNDRCATVSTRSRERAAAARLFETSYRRLLTEAAVGSMLIFITYNCIESGGDMGADDMLTRLERATNAHDLEALVDCFAVDYRNETPAHPARSFVGRDQVRANWGQIFEGVPDLQARVVASVVDDATVWSEWEMWGTRRDGNAHAMRGVVVFRVVDSRASSGRFYVEPVDRSAGDVNEAIRSAVGTER